MSRSIPWIQMFILLLCLMAAVGAQVLRNDGLRTKQVVQMPITLEDAVPTTFGDWRLTKPQHHVTVAADVQAALDSLYSQLIQRTYENAQGERIMLVIAYGSDQNAEATQLHRPEFCYNAQGFNLYGRNDVALPIAGQALTLRQIVAQKGNRVEPITYWITVGDRVSLPGWQRKLDQIVAGLKGQQVDGYLIRISSIDLDVDRGLQRQTRFANDLMAALPSNLRARLLGQTKSSLLPQGAP